ncbi:MAG: hypothetical protein ABIG52_03445 [Nanoarchaeota archaeon]|nr:hypothetical protein [Nanoarchaeota archaeon]MBU1644161.1 hypothetical protein [Nanoarchaeota archaeon]
MALELIIGIVGMFFIVLGFVLEEFHQKWNQDTKKYNLVNILGSSLLIYYAVILNSIPFIILNSVWLIAATYKMVKIFK